MTARPSVNVWHGDIGEADVDVVVNASNTLLRLGSGVSGAIRRAAGPGFQAELDAILQARAPGGLEPGDVIVTGAGGHPRAKHVAHVAVMDYREGPGLEPRPSLERVRRGARLLWQHLEEIGEPISVGMVALGAGTGGLGLRSSVGVSCETLVEHLGRTGDSRLRAVTFVAYELVEFINTVAVVKAHFDIDLSGLPEDALRLLEVVDND